MKNFINEAKEETYDIPWDAEFDSDIGKWENKYELTIRRKNKDEASITGQDANIIRFLKKELDFDDDDDNFEMMGL
jgi:hypothetical protein